MPPKLAIMTTKLKTKRKRPATARDPVLGGRELRHVIDVTDVEAEMLKALNRIRARDGAKVFRKKRGMVARLSRCHDRGKGRRCVAGPQQSRR